MIFLDLYLDIDTRRQELSPKLTNLAAIFEILKKGKLRLGP